MDTSRKGHILSLDPRIERYMELVLGSSWSLTREDPWASYWEGPGLRNGEVPGVRKGNIPRTHIGKSLDFVK